MAKRSSRAKISKEPAKRRVGRPNLSDANDYKSEKFTFRLHPDLRRELAREARERGDTVARVVELTLIAMINRHGSPIFDAIGRKMPNVEESGRSPKRP